MQDEMMTVREVARVCDRSEETVRRWIWSGKLAAQKLGNQLFVKREDVEAVRSPRAGEAKAAYETSSGGSALFEQYDYSPLQEIMEEHHGRYLPSTEQEARQIAEDEAFQDELMAQFGRVHVLRLLDRGA